MLFATYLRSKCVEVLFILNIHKVRVSLAREAARRPVGRYCTDTGRTSSELGTLLLQGFQGTARIHPLAVLPSYSTGRLDLHAWRFISWWLFVWNDEREPSKESAEGSNTCHADIMTTVNASPNTVPMEDGPNVRGTAD